MKRSNRVASCIVSGVLLAVLGGCSNGPEHGPSASTATPPGKAPPKPAAAVAPSTPTAAPTTAGTPAVGGSPVASGSPKAVATGGADPEFEKAQGQPGFDDVKKIGKNPLAGDAGATEKGKALFTQNCVPCHGDSGKGDGPAGAALDPKPRNLTAKAEFKYGTGDLSLFRTVKYGVQGSGMAPWDGRMSDEEVWQVVNFVKTLQ